jgi:hypothetical protein
VVEEGHGQALVQLQADQVAAQQDRLAVEQVVQQHQDKVMLEVPRALWGLLTTGQVAVVQVQQVMPAEAPVEEMVRVVQALPVQQTQQLEQLVVAVVAVVAQQGQVGLTQAEALLQLARASSLLAAVVVFLLLDTSFNRRLIWHILHN